MESVIYFVFWALFFVAMMRLGCGAHAMGHGSAKRASTPAPADDRPRTPRLMTPERAVDPICGRTIRTDHAKSSLHDGRAYYFCSRDCREIFEAAPETYPDPVEAGAPRSMARSHA
jgi:YHS domain-containing protein